jgi:aminoglycoside phosphotransferase (APT) family kinase protein
VPGTDRSIRFQAEATLGALLAGRGHPVASWTVIEIDGISCVVGERLSGSPIAYGGRWTPAFCARLGDLLTDLHALPATGFGPLVNDPGQLRGETRTAREGARRRWCWAPCWPFDGSDLADHPVARLLPEAAPVAATQQQALLVAAAEGQTGVVHSDLHREHLLAGAGGELTGVLDFGDAFVGVAAWDFALLHWYYGPEISRAVARHHPGGTQVHEQGRLLALAVGLYKLAKSPTDSHVPPRLRRLLSAAQS